MDKKIENTLSQPAITYWDFKDNKIILYIEAIDLRFSIINVFKINENGSSTNSDYIGTTNTLSENGRYKIFEYPINKNGKYIFEVQLYNPLYESSNFSNPVIIYIGDYLDPDGEMIDSNVSLKIEELLTPKQIIKKYPEDVIYDENTDIYYYTDPETSITISLDMTSKEKISIFHKPYLVNDKIQILTNEQGSKITI